MRKWYNFETRFITLRDALRKYLKDNHIKYELSEAGVYYHFEIYANNMEVESVNNFINSITIEEEA